MANYQDFWPAFGETGRFTEIVQTGTGSLAEDVLNYFRIPTNNTGGLGGNLNGLDIKHMEAMQIVSLSLLEQTALSDRIYETVVNEDGEVEFRAIGTYTGLTGADIYYEIQTGVYKEDVSGVMIIGQKPLPVRNSPVFKSILDNAQIFNTSLLYNPDCVTKDFSQYATIVYDDPQMSSAYEDNIDNFYNIGTGNPWDSIIGYAWYMHYDGWENSSINVQRASTAKIMVKVEAENLGNIQNRPKFVTNEDVTAECFQGTGQEANFGDGVRVQIPENFSYTTVRGVTTGKFLGVLDVYVKGRDLSYLNGEPVNDAAAIKTSIGSGDAKIMVGIEEAFDRVFKLERGTNYAVAYQGDGPNREAAIVFTNNSVSLDAEQFRGTPTFYIDPGCTYAAKTQKLQETGIILPTGQFKGIWVKEIMVSIELDTPSVVVFNPDGFNLAALRVAETLDLQAAALTVTEEPPPVAFNGTLLTQEDSIRDGDPTEAQNFDNTEMELAYDVMDGGGGITLNLSFLDADGARRLSSALFDYMNSGDGTEATYICGPGANVQLGGTAPNGGIVNSINYSYQDSNSYTISVNAGGKLVGNFSQISGGPSFKQSENDTSAKGTVIADLGNHVHYKVRIDGYGDRTAINMCPEVIRVGDKVQCSINNNPVEA
jgi:hypothetical protein